MLGIALEGHGFTVPSEWESRAALAAEGRSPAEDCPTQAKTGLEWATASALQVQDTVLKLIKCRHSGPEGFEIEFFRDLFV